MSNSQHTGFDAFFQAITTSPEFKTAITKDWKGDSIDALEKSLLEMQSGVDKANSLMGTLNTNFATELVTDTRVEPGKNNSPLNTNPPKTRNTKDEIEKPILEIEHFTKVEGKLWGFEAVAGMEKLKNELSESFIKPLKFKFMVEKLKNNSNIANVNAEDIRKNELILKLYSEYEKFKISIPTGMLLYGPPGTGKTFITRKLAEELGCGFISKNMGEFGSSYLHQTTKNIKDFFTGAKQASETEPIILFLDEIDSLVSARTNNIDSGKSEEVSQFLQEFNSLESAPNLIVIAATNRPDHLDPAILRSGRLDKKIYLGPPDESARKALFEMYIDKKGRPHTKLDYEELAKLTDGYVSADIEAICDEVARDASRNLLELIDEASNGNLKDKDLDGHTITMDSIRETILETPSSLKMVDMSIYENWLEKIK